MTTSDLEKDPVAIKELIAEIRDSHDDGCSILLEHLESARINFQGGMPEEGLVSLELADDSSGSLRDESLRKRTRERIQDWLKDLHDPHHMRQD